MIASDPVAATAPAAAGMAVAALAPLLVTPMQEEGKALGVPMRILAWSLRGELPMKPRAPPRLCALDEPVESSPEAVWPAMLDVMGRRTDVLEVLWYAPPESLIGTAAGAGAPTPPLPS